MELTGFLKKNVLSIVVMLSIGFLTFNMVMPLHPKLNLLTTYAMQIILLFIGLGFLALKMQKPQIMLACFVGSIFACNYMHPKAEATLMKTKESNSVLVRPIDNKALSNKKNLPTPVSITHAATH